MKNTLGILGGMGPMASQLLYRMITERTAAERDQDHINIIIYSHADMPDRTSAIMQDRAGELKALLLEDCLALQRAGCRAICISCNTSHFLVPELQQQLRVPIINMVQESAARIGRDHRGKKAAILATDGTLRMGLYQKALADNGVDPYVPSAEGQEIVMHLIYDCVKAGLPADGASLRALDAELRNAGCSAALLACTELSVIQADGDLREPFYVDAMGVLAERAITFMGRKLRK